MTDPTENDLEALREQLQQIACQTAEALGDLNRMETHAGVLERGRVMQSIKGYFTVIRRKVREHPPSALISETVDTLATEALAKLDTLDSVQRGIQTQEYFGEPEGMATHEQSDMIEDDALDQEDGT